MKLKVIVAISAVIIFIAACQNEEDLEFKRYYSSGALIYQSHCQNCHGDNGEGLSALIPPLTDSSYLKKNQALLPCFIKSGLKGSVTIKSKSFEGAMPAIDLSPVEIAEVLTYIGNSFGNKLKTVNEQRVQLDLADCQ